MVLVKYLDANIQRSDFSDMGPKLQRLLKVKDNPS